MVPGKLINPDILAQQHRKDLYMEFCSNKPIRHIVIDNFLDKDFATIISSHFPAVEEMKTHYRGINEKKSEHSDFSKLHTSFSQLHSVLSSDDFIGWLQQVTSIEKLEAINDRLGYGLH